MGRAGAPGLFLLGAGSDGRIDSIRDVSHARTGARAAGGPLRAHAGLAVHLERNLHDGRNSRSCATSRTIHENRKAWALRSAQHIAAASRWVLDQVQECATRRAARFGHCAMLRPLRCVSPDAAVRSS